MGVNVRRHVGAALPHAVLVVVLAGLVALTVPAGPQIPAVDLSPYPWLYLRAGLPLAEGEQLVELMAVGDLMLGRGVAGERDPLGDAAPWLGAADLALGNFEGVLAGSAVVTQGRDEGPPEPYRLTMPESAAKVLHQAGFDLLGLANNHALDFGPEALAASRSRLQAAGLQTLGAGPDPARAWEPVIRRVGDLHLAFLACNAVPVPSVWGPGWAPARCDAVQSEPALQEARERADAVVVSVHWGYEYQAQVDPAQRRMAERLLAAGADLVLGHHPHVVQDVQVFPLPVAREREAAVVAYSLGNFVFDQYEGRANQGLAVRAFFDRDGLRGVQALPVWAGGRPRLMTPAEATPLLARLAPASQRLAFMCDRETCHRVAERQENRTGASQPGGTRKEETHVSPCLAHAGTALLGRFRSGGADLTGDSLPEQVRLQGCGVAIYREERRVWESPPEWQVLDLALGDPNDDGREELLIALLKADDEGHMRSHPFIVGFRGGAYRLLWGGSAVSEPILEVELGDVDSDGVQELLVVEALAAEGETALSVWRWHGWGFSLVWRSFPGWYRDVVFVPGGAGERPTIQVTRSASKEPASLPGQDPAH